MKSHEFISAYNEKAKEKKKAKRICTKIFLCQSLIKRLEESKLTINELHTMILTNVQNSGLSHDHQ